MFRQFTKQPKKLKILSSQKLNNRKMYKYSIILITALVLNSCSNAQQNGKTALAANEFSEKLKASHDAQLVDVRTPEEFKAGHLENAKNFDWNNDNFDMQMNTLDKTKPVFVYCLSGGRSGAAAKKMRSEGFKEVYEMQGGMIKWRAANMPETNEPENAATANKGMNKLQFEELLKSDKLVLVDFYADWCGPCQKMKPYIEEIEKEMKYKVKVVRINADQNKELYKQLGITSLPTIRGYKNNVMRWSAESLLTKEELMNAINKVQ